MRHRKSIQVEPLASLIACHRSPKNIKSEITTSPYKSDIRFPNLTNLSRPLKDENTLISHDSPYSTTMSSHKSPLKNPTSGETGSIAVSMLPSPPLAPTTTPSLPEKSLEAMLGQNKPFARYYVQYCEENPLGYQMSESERYNFAWKSWNQLSPADRGSFYTLEESPDPLNNNTSPDGTTALDYEDRKSGSRFDYEAQFQDDNTFSAVDDDQPKKFQLQTFIADASLEVLETSIDKGVKLLEDLKGPLRGNLERSQDAALWLEQIERLQKQAVRTRTIIGK